MRSTLGRWRDRSVWNPSELTLTTGATAAQCRSKLSPPIVSHKREYLRILSGRLSENSRQGCHFLDSGDYAKTSQGALNTGLPRKERQLSLVDRLAGWGGTIRTSMWAN